MSISVALCTHNGERFIEEQLRSILVQAQLPDEMVVSDDASTDRTLAIIEETWANAAAPKPLLRIIRNSEPLGVSRNFEQAVTATTGGLIVLADQDDLWTADRIEKLTLLFDARPDLQLVFGNARLVDHSGHYLGSSLFDALEVTPRDLSLIRAGAAMDVLLRRNIATGATMMFRRSLLDAAIPFDRSWVHDEWLAIIAAAGSEIDWVDEPLVDYRQHGENQIGVAVPSLRYKIRRVLSPRGDRYTDLVRRAEGLTERLKQLDVTTAALTEAEQKLAHQRARAALPDLRIARLAGIVREIRSGRYGRYSSRGRLDILRDLLQPAR